MKPAKREIDYGKYGVKISENKSLGFGYSPEFKKFVKDNPGALPTIQELIDGNYDLLPKQKVKKNGVTVQMICRKGDLKGMLYNLIYKVTVGSHEFFVKKELVNTGHGGLNELKSQAILRDVLKDEPDVKVVQYLFGYSDEYNDHVYIAKWENNFIPLSNRLEELIQSRKKKELDELLAKVRDLNQKCVKAGFDPLEADLPNMYWDENDKKIVIFDQQLKHRHDITPIEMPDLPSYSHFRD